MEFVLKKVDNYGVGIVMVYRLVAKDTVEEGILALQERKRATAEAVLGEADRAVGLTRDDLLWLLT